jgi:hypothetical protein
MSDKYGVFADLVGIAGSLAAAATAISLAFLKRSKWQPPKEVVADGTARVSSLATAVFIGLLYVFGRRVGEVPLGVVAAVLVAVAVWALTISIRTNVRYSFYYPDDGQEPHRLLGGDQLTEEAAGIVKAHKQTVQQLLTDARGKTDLVWTRESRADVASRSTLGFLGLIVAGSCALAAVAMLVSIYVRSGG